MKLTKQGIIFNKEAYPNYKPDEFAQAFIDIIEKKFTWKPKVHFKKTEEFED